MLKFTIASHRKRQILDITEQVESHLPEAIGIVCLNILHTTAALTTADLDPGTDLDMLDAFEASSVTAILTTPNTSPTTSSPRSSEPHSPSPSSPARSPSAPGSASSSSSSTVPALATSPSTFSRATERHGDSPQRARRSAFR